MVLTHIQGDPVSVPWTMTMRLICVQAHLPQMMHMGSHMAGLWGDGTCQHEEPLV